MFKKICDKLRRGKLSYQVDSDNRTISLVSDFPLNGAVGGSFDSTPVHFDDINAVLNESQIHQSRDFTHCFAKHSGNNSPMLAAVLVDMGILQKAKNLFIVLKTL